MHACIHTCMHIHPYTYNPGRQALTRLSTWSPLPTCKSQPIIPSHKIRLIKQDKAKTEKDNDEYDWFAPHALAHARREVRKLFVKINPPHEVCCVQMWKRYVNTTAAQTPPKQDATRLRLRRTNKKGECNGNNEHCANIHYTNTPTNHSRVHPWSCVFVCMLVCMSV
jgi:hypothetical protein